MEVVRTRSNSNVNVRELPNVTSKVNHVLKPDEKINYLGNTRKQIDGIWLEVQHGWVRSDLVVIEKSLPNELEVSLTRLHDTGNSIIGALTVIEKGRLIFSCKTLELSWKDNQNRISAIPTGTYAVKMTYSPRFKKDLYLLENVPDRAGVRIHSANFASQLHGCIALGSDTKDINADGQLDIIHSGRTMAEFESLMKGKPFTLTIKNSY